MTEFKSLAFGIVECCNCHVLFCMTQEHIKTLIGNKGTFYCPNGHSQSYTGKSNTNIITELKQKIDACGNRKNELLNELESKDKSIKAYKMLYAREKKARLKDKE